MRWPVILIFVSALAAAQSDPFEPLNRVVHGFNDFFDQLLLKPAAQGYQLVTPEVVDQGVTNVFENLAEPRNAVNHLLQGKVAGSGRAVGRFALNTTIGLGGFFDPAHYVGWPYVAEDFGQTLAVWGVSSGPYLVLPLLGPSTLRDGLAGAGDYALSPLPYVYRHLQVPWYMPVSITALDAVDQRAALLSVESLLTGDRYIAMRDFYLENRAFQIADGKVEDDFSAGLGGADDIEDFGDL